MKIWHDLFSEHITLESLFQAWSEFRKGKKSRKDVQFFERNLEDNIFLLHSQLNTKRYRHGEYQEFYIRDPKVRHIHKASVRDRVVHHLVSSVIERVFDPTFFVHSYSCREKKGTHRAIQAFVARTRKMSRNNTSSLFVLKCDIHQFFGSVDHEILLRLLARKIWDPDFLWLLEEIVRGFVVSGIKVGKGMPIGNLTSQFFANIYLDPLDAFMKHAVKVDSYFRYADDFVILGKSREELVKLIPHIQHFLQKKLLLQLHPKKIFIRDYYQGIDFLGCVVLPHFQVLRTKTKKRMFRKLREKAKLVNMKKIDTEVFQQTLQSYLGLISHSNSFILSQKVKNSAWFWIN